MTQTVSSTKVQKLDSAIYYALLGLALSLNCSIAGVSIFLSITSLLMLVRIYLKRDDLSLLKNIPSGFAACFLGELFHPVLPADDAASNAPAEYDEVRIPEESRCGFFEGQDICSERFGNPLRIPAGIAGMGFV